MYQVGNKGNCQNWMKMWFNFFSEQTRLEEKDMQHCNSHLRFNVTHGRLRLNECIGRKSISHRSWLLAVAKSQTQIHPCIILQSRFDTSVSYGNCHKKWESQQSNSPKCYNIVNYLVSNFFDDCHYDINRYSYLTCHLIYITICFSWRALWM